MSSSSDTLFAKILHASTGVLGSMAVGLAWKMAMPRLLGPDELGQLYFAEAYVSMFLAVIPLGLGTYLVRTVPSDPHHAFEVLPGLRKIQFFVFILAYLIMISTLLFSGDSGKKIILVTIFGIGTAMALISNEIYRSTLQSFGASKRLARIDIFAKCFQVSTALISVFFFPNAIAASSCFLIGQIASFAMIGFALNSYKKSTRYTLASFQKIKEIVKESLPFFATTVVMSLYTSLDVTMIEKQTNSVEVGLYGTSVRLQGLFYMFFPVLSGAFLPYFSRIFKSDIDKFHSDFEKFVISILPLFSILAICSISVVDIGSTLLFGDQYARSHLASATLTPVMIFTYLNWLLGFRLILLQKSKACFAIAILGLVANGTLNYFMIPYFFVKTGVGGAGFGASLATVFSELLVTFCYVFTGFRIKRALFLAARILACFIPFVALIYFHSDWYPVVLWKRVFFIVFGYLAYLFILRILSLSGMTWLKELLSRKFEVEAS